MDDIGDLRGQHSAIGVAQGEHLRARLDARAQRFEGVGAVHGIPIEEVLRIEEDAPPSPTRKETVSRIIRGSRRASSAGPA